MKEKFTELMEEYGRIAVILYFAIFFLTLFSFYALLKTGFAEAIIEWSQLSVDEDSIAVSSMVIAYGLTKITQVPRIMLTILLLPLFSSKRKDKEEQQEKE